MLRWLILQFASGNIARSNDYGVLRIVMMVLILAGNDTVITGNLGASNVGYKYCGGIAWTHTRSSTQVYLECFVDSRAGQRSGLVSIAARFVIDWLPSAEPPRRESRGRRKM